MSHLLQVSPDASPENPPSPPGGNAWSSPDNARDGNSSTFATGVGTTDNVAARVRYKVPAKASSHVLWCGIEIDHEWTASSTTPVPRVKFQRPAGTTIESVGILTTSGGEARQTRRFLMTKANWLPANSDIYLQFEADPGNSGETITVKIYEVTLLGVPRGDVTVQEG